jgi:hypothetical protein
MKQDWEVDRGRSTTRHSCAETPAETTAFRRLNLGLTPPTSKQKRSRIQRDESRNPSYGKLGGDLLPIGLAGGKLRWIRRMSLAGYSSAGWSPPEPASAWPARKPILDSLDRSAMPENACLKLWLRSVRQSIFGPQRATVAPSGAPPREGRDGALPFAVPLQRSRVVPDCSEQLDELLPPASFGSRDCVVWRAARAFVFPQRHALPSTIRNS